MTSSRRLSTPWVLALLIVATVIVATPAVAQGHRREARNAGITRRTAAGGAEVVRISTRAVIEESIVDRHAGTGNLFVVLRGFILYENDNFWSVNISEDNGKTWTETYYWEVAEWFDDIDAVVIGDYLYVAFQVATLWPGSARLQRFFVQNGAQDTQYGTQEVVDSPWEICELALASNADHANGRLYYLLVESDGDLRYFWADDEGGLGAWDWEEVATGVTDADSHLDAIYTLATDYFVYASYVGTDGNLYVWRNGVGQDHTQIETSVTTPWQIKMSAYQDVVLVAYPYGESPNRDIKYRITYNGGDSWLGGTVATGADYVSPAVTLRNGGGVTVVYGQNTDTYDQIWMRRRGYLGGNWTEPIQCSQWGVDPWEGTSVEAVPGIGNAVVHNTHGPDATAYFTMVSHFFFDGFETGDLSLWSAAAP